MAARAVFARIAVLGAALLAAGCSRNDEAPKVAEGRDHIACALGPGAAFQPVCAVDRISGDSGLELVVRHPDGGFRRFTVLPDGRGLAAADGADIAQLALAGNFVEVTVGADRYRFPFTEKRGDGAR